MTTQNRYYSNVAATTFLANNGGLSPSTNLLEVGNNQGFPTSFPFILRIEPNTTNEEVVLVTSGSGSTSIPYVVVRGYSSSGARQHAPNVIVRHGFIDLDLQEPQNHMGSVEADLPHGLPRTAWDGGFLQLIKTQTVTGSSAPNIPFLNIPQQYTHLMFTASVSNTGTNNPGLDGLMLQWNGMNTNYNNHEWSSTIGGSTTLGAVSIVSQPWVNIGLCLSSYSGNAGGVGYTQGWIMEYTGDLLYKSVISSSSGSAAGSTGGLFQMFGTNNNSSNGSPITSLTFYPSSSNFTVGSTISLYGLF